MENSVFCEIYQRLTLWKTRENGGFQSLIPDEREVLHQKTSVNASKQHIRQVLTDR